MLIRRLRWRSYLIFAAASFAFVPVVWRFYPETAGLSLEEIDGLFVGVGEDPVGVGRRVRRERAGIGRSRGDTVGGEEDEKRREGKGGEGGPMEEVKMA